MLTYLSVNEIREDYTSLSIKFLFIIIILRQQFVPLDF